MQCAHVSIKQHLQCQLPVSSIYLSHGGLIGESNSNWTVQ